MIFCTYFCILLEEEKSNINILLQIFQTLQSLWQITSTYFDSMYYEKSMDL